MVGLTLTHIDTKIEGTDIKGVEEKVAQRNYLEKNPTGIGLGMKNIISSISVTDIVFNHYLSKWNYSNSTKKTWNNSLFIL